MYGTLEDYIKIHRDQGTDEFFIVSIVELDDEDKEVIDNYGYEIAEYVNDIDNLVEWYNYKYLVKLK